MATATMIARITSASDQPNDPISAVLVGAKTNCPADPPAVTMPSHKTRDCAGATRPTRASGKVKPTPAAPSPTTKPADRIMLSGVVEIEISAMPIA